MLDSDLAALYGVPTKRLNEAVKRNMSRFPTNFMFRLTSEEAELLSRKLRPQRQSRWSSVSSICFYRTRRGDAFCRINADKRELAKRPILRAYRCESAGSRRSPRTC